MGEFTSGGTLDNALDAQRTEISDTENGFPTDVEGISAHGSKDGMPVFNVEEDDFYNNMKSDRKRLRFKSDNPVSQYLKSTYYKKPFYIATTNKDGQTFLRKVK